MKIILALIMNSGLRVITLNVNGFKDYRKHVIIINLVHTVGQILSVYRTLILN